MIRIKTKRVLLLFFLNSCFFLSGRTQSSSVDRNKITDFFQNQQYDEAIDYISPIANADSSNLQLLGYLGYAYYMNENLPLAEHYYERVLRIDSNNITALQYLSNIYFNSNPDIAEGFVRRLVQAKPNKASYQRLLGDLYRRLHLRDSAYIYLERAYELAPTDNRNIAALADVLIESKLYPSADSILSLGLERDSLNVALLKLTIRSSYESKKYKDVPGPGERLIAQNDITLSTLTQVALAYYNLKQYNDCIRVCEFMLNHDLEIESVYYYESRAWAKLNHFEKSNELLQVCLDKAISKTAELYYYNLGSNFESLKQYKKAVANYDTAYYLFKNPVMCYNCGRICESNLKNMKLAKKYYALFLKGAKPENPEEKKAYEYVKSRWAKGNGK